MGNVVTSSSPTSQFNFRSKSRSASFIETNGTKGKYTWKIASHLLQTMISAVNGEFFTSDTFQYGGCIWQFVIYPNGCSKNRSGSFDVRIKLKTMPQERRTLKINWRICTKQIGSSFTGATTFSCDQLDAECGWKANTLSLAEVMSVMKNNQQPLEIEFSININDKLEFKYDPKTNMTWQIHPDLFHQLKNGASGKQAVSNVYNEIFVIGIRANDNNQSMISLILYAFPSCVSKLDVCYKVTITTNDTTIINTFTRKHEFNSNTLFDEFKFMEYKLFRTLSNLIINFDIEIVNLFDEDGKLVHTVSECKQQHQWNEEKANELMRNHKIRKWELLNCSHHVWSDVSQVKQKYFELTQELTQYQLICEQLMISPLQNIYASKIILTKMLVVIICVGEYDQKILSHNSKAKLLNNLPGTQIDRLRLVKLCKKQYKYDIISNKKPYVTVKDMKCILQRAEESFGDIANGYEGIMVFYSGHGNQQYLLLSDFDGNRGKYKRSDFESYFNGYNIKDKINSYKLFFIDSCRGITESRLLTTNDAVNARSKGDEIKREDVNLYHPEENRCILHSNCNSYKSYEVPYDATSEDIAWNKMDDEKYDGPYCAIFMNSVYHAFNDNANHPLGINFSDIQDKIRDKVKVAVKLKDNGRHKWSVGLEIEEINNLKNKTKREMIFRCNGSNRIEYQRRINMLNKSAVNLNVSYW